MAFGLGTALIPPLQRGIGALVTLLDRAECHARAHQMDEVALLAARLAPDMWPLVKQVQVASDFAKNGPLRLAGQVPAVWPDDEVSISELRTRLSRNLALLAQMDRADLDHRASVTVTFPIGDQHMSLSGVDYVTAFVFPNFYFHITAAYAILRHIGVPVTKRDYLGTL